MSLLHDHGCTRCPLHETATTVCLEGEGPLTARLLVVGEAPGYTEDQTGRPFVGESGQLLREVLDDLGVEYRLETGVVRCRPPGNRKPRKKDEIDPCSVYLERLLDRMPVLELIVPLGKTAKDWFKVPGGQMETAGKVHEVDGRVIVPIAHPAYVLRQQQYLDTWLHHWAVVKNLLTGDRPGVKFSQGGSCLGPFTLDLETTGLDQRICSPTAVGFVDSQGQTFARSIDSASSWLILGMVAKETSTVFSLYDIVCFRHWFGTWHDGRGLTDVLLLAKRVHPEGIGPGGGLSLKALTSRYIPDLAGYDVGVRDTTPWHEKGSEALCRYVATDAWATWKLREILSEKLSPEELSHHEEDVRIGLLFERMAERGLPLDVNVVARMREEQKQIKAEVLSFMGDVNPGSPQQVAELLTTLGVDVPVNEESGNPVTDEPTLNRLLEEDLDARARVVIERVLAYRSAVKTDSTYLCGYLRQIDWADERIHSSFWWPGTISWRPTSSEPNVLNLSRSLRDIIGTKEGKTLFEVDYGQIQLRIATALSGDPAFTEVFMDGLDGHAIFAQELYGEDFTKDQRYTAKTANFTLVFDGTANALFTRFKKDGFPITMSECRRIATTWRRKHRTLVKYMESVQEAARHGEVIHAPEAGYRWTLDQVATREGAEHHALRSIANLPVQSVESRFVARAILRLEEEGIPAILHTYDGALFEVDEQDAEEAARRAVAVFEEVASVPWMNGIPIPADAKIGRWWGSMEELK